MSDKTFDISKVQGLEVPGNWEFEQVFGDIIMAEPADENEQGEVLRDHIYIKQDITRMMWRVAKVLLVGPTVKQVKAGDLVMYPSDRGLPMVTFDRQKRIFLNEERIFGIVKPAVSKT